MDLSKLPKLSQTPQPADNAEQTPEEASPQTPSRSVLDYRAPEPVAPMSGGEVWFAAIVGVIFIFLSRSFPTWLIRTLTGKAFATGVVWNVGPKAGQPVAYWELQGHTALSDMAIFLFGIAVVFEAAMYLVWLRNSSRLQAVTWVALAMTALATGLNLLAVSVLWSDGITPLTSLLAVAFGGWMFVQQRGLLSWLRGTEATNRHTVQ